MKPNLVELIARVLNVPPDDLTMESGPATVSQWDSLAHMTITAAVESTYQVELTMPEILSVHSVAHLLTLLEARGVAESVGGTSE